MPDRGFDFEAWSMRLAFGVLTAVALVFLVAPTLVVLLTSFTSSESLKFPPEGYSFRW
jgi:putative spermidine/putrescine transport system permease protein